MSSTEDPVAKARVEHSVSAAVPADTGMFRNVVPKVVEDMLKRHQAEAWNNPI